VKTIAFKTTWLPKIHLKKTSEEKIEEIKAHTISLKAKEATIDLSH
jgi:hypothetical protein